MIWSLDRASSFSTTVSYINDQERKTRLFSHYSHYRHGSASVDKSTDHNDKHRMLSHVIKAQRHSDPYSIKWITQRPDDIENLGM